MVKKNYNYMVYHKLSTIALVCIYSLLSTGIWNLFINHYCHADISINHLHESGQILKKLNFKLTAVKYYFCI